MNTLFVKKGDTVTVLSGKEKGKKGKVIAVDPGKQMVIVEGVNVATRHTKPKRQGEPGGIIKKELGLRACKVMRVCPKCSKATRPAARFDDGKKVTVCKKCGAAI